MAKLISLMDGLRMMSVPTTHDVYTLPPLGQCELNTPCPTAMSDEAWAEVKEWLALVIRRGDRQRAKEAAKKVTPAAPEPNG